MAVLIQFKVTVSESKKIAEIVSGDNTLGLETAADLFRLLLHREWNRRKGLPKPKGIDWQGGARQGRPAKR